VRKKRGEEKAGGREGREEEKRKEGRREWSGDKRRGMQVEGGEGETYHVFGFHPLSSSNSWPLWRYSCLSSFSITTSDPSFNAEIASFNISLSTIMLVTAKGEKNCVN